ncbi:MAG: LysM peptidoglycan-binding domain-containing protein [Planctomycetota bacterium]|jgi:hypothetical protein
MKLTSRLAGGLVLLAALSLVAPPADADIIIPGEREVSTEVTVDYGILKASAPERYEVKAGDSFGEIAQRLLGSARRWEEIQEWNPGVEPERMTVGSYLWLPPLDPPAADAEVPHYDVFYFAPFNSRQRRLLRLVPGVKLPYHRNGGVRIVVVRHDRLAAVLEAVAKGDDLPGTVAALREAGHVALSFPFGGRQNVAEGDPRTVIRQRLRIAAVEDGTVELGTMPGEPDPEGAALPVLPTPPWVFVLVLLAVVAAAVFALRGAPRPSEAK